MPPSIWVAQLLYSEATARKLAALHSLDVEEVSEAVECVQGLLFAWHFDESRGWRAIVRTRIGTRDVLVVLYDAGDPMGDVWNLGSAYPE